MAPPGSSGLAMRLQPLAAIPSQDSPSSAKLLNSSLCEARSSKPRSTALEPILLIIATAAIPLDRVVLAEI
jgi:hypothetical protein